MKAKITTRLATSIKPKRTRFDVYDVDVAGFIMRVEVSGRKGYYVKYRLDRRQRMMKIDARTPEQARRKALKELCRVSDGEDPALDRKRMQGITLRHFLDMPHDALGGKTYEDWLFTTEKKKSAVYTVDRIRRAFPCFLDKPMINIAQQDIDRWKKGYADREASGNRHLFYLRSAFRNAARKGIIPANPLHGVEMLAVRTKDGDPEKNRSQYLLSQEEPRLWRAVDEYEERIRIARDTQNARLRAQGFPELPDLRQTTYADFVRPLLTVALNCGLRRGELIALKWSDINFGERL